VIQKRRKKSPKNNNNNNSKSSNIIALTATPCLLSLSPFRTKINCLLPMSVCVAFLFCLFCFLSVLF
jgi:hypothetical protein